MSFVLLTESQLVPPHGADAAYNRASGKSAGQDAGEHGRSSGGDDSKRSMAYQMERAARLFEILSARSDIDHPVCVECTEILIEGLQTRLQHVTKERDAFVEFLKKVNEDVPTEEEKRKAEEELRARRQEEEAAYAELVQLEQEKAKVDEEIAQLEEEARRLDIEEERFWRERNAFTLKLSEFQNERDSVNLQYEHDARQLERLQRTNVYNDTFCIGHDGYFGTINGLRLGRLPNQPVEWAEINAAWGQTLLLLATVAEKLSFTFDGYRLKPMGSTSKIERIEYAAASATAFSSSSSSPSTANHHGNDQQETLTSRRAQPHGDTQGQHRQQQTPPPKTTALELYSSGDLPIGRMFLHRKLDQAMVAFLECLRQLGDFVERQTTSDFSSVGASVTSPSRTNPISPSRTNPTNPTNPTGDREGSGASGGTATAGKDARNDDKVVRLPYEIKKDRIGDASIKLGFNQDEAWTRACKYTLTCCKFVLAHASNLGGAGRRGGGGGGGLG